MLCGKSYIWNNKGTYSKPSDGIPKTDLASDVQTSLGKADTSLQHTTVTGSPDLDTYLTTGIYHIATQTATHAPTTNHATLFVDATVGTPYQIFKPDTSDTVWYTRHRSGSAWTAWVTMKFTDTTYSDATTSVAGLMSASDKTKLNGIATGANKTTVDSALSSTSTNPVQNKIVNSAIADRAPRSFDDTITSGSMNDLDGGCVLCTNNVTGGPVADYCFVRTRIYDNNAAVQHLIVPSSNTMHMRCKWAGTWSTWKQIV